VERVVPDALISDLQFVGGVPTLISISDIKAQICTEAKPTSDNLKFAARDSPAPRLHSLPTCSKLSDSFFDWSRYQSPFDLLLFAF
jgi:hypothetical protein